MRCDETLPLLAYYKPHPIIRNLISMGTTKVRKAKPFEMGELRATNLINEIDKVSDMDISYKYQNIIIKQIIQDWRDA